MIALCTEWPSADNALLRAEFSRTGIEVVEIAPPCARSSGPASGVRAAWPAWLRLSATAVYERCDPTGECVLAEQFASNNRDERRAVVAHFVEVFRPDGASWAALQRPTAPRGPSAPPVADPSAWSLALYMRQGMGPLPLRAGVGVESTLQYTLDARWAMGLSAAALRTLGGTDFGRARVQATHVPVVVGVERMVVPGLQMGAYVGVSALAVQGEDRPNITQQSGWALLPRAELRANWQLLKAKHVSLTAGLRAGLPLVGAEIGVLTPAGYSPEGTASGPDVSYVLGAVFR